MKKQTGFTLIELAIVLVIIGLLLGGVLKGQELINSAKVKNMASDFRNAQVYIYGYQDRFKALPGDDISAQSHLGLTATPATTGGASRGDGVIGGNWDTITGSDESCVMWQHLRLAGFAPGTTTVSCAAGNTYQPKNADGGLFGLQSVSGFTTITKSSTGTASAMSGAYVACSSGVLGKYAKQLDITMDDGDTDTGSMRVADPAANGQSFATTSVADATPYTICLAF